MSIMLLPMLLSSFVPIYIMWSDYWSGRQVKTKLVVQFSCPHIRRRDYLIAFGQIQMRHSHTSLSSYIRINVPVSGEVTTILIKIYLQQHASVVSPLRRQQSLQLFLSSVFSIFFKKAGANGQEGKQGFTRMHCVFQGILRISSSESCCALEMVCCSWSAAMMSLPLQCSAISESRVQRR